MKKYILSIFAFCYCLTAFGQIPPVNVWTPGGGNIYFNGGNVGIGLNSPLYPLHVNGFAFFSHGITAKTITTGYLRTDTLTGGLVAAQSLNVQSLATFSGGLFSPTIHVSGLAGVGEREVFVDTTGNLTVARPLNPSSYPSCTSTNPAWRIGGNNVGSRTGANIGTCDYYDFILKANNTEHLWLKPDGKLGIGTSTPSARLDITTLNDGTAGLNITNSGVQLFNIGNTGGTLINSTSSSISPFTIKNTNITTANTNIFEVNPIGTTHIRINTIGTTSVPDALNIFDINSGTFNFRIKSDGSTIINCNSSNPQSMPILVQDIQTGSNFSVDVYGATHINPTHNILGLEINAQGPTGWGAVIDVTDALSTAFDVKNGTLFPATPLFQILGDGTTSIHGISPTISPFHVFSQFTSVFEVQPNGNLKAPDLVVAASTGSFNGLFLDANGNIVKSSTSQSSTLPGWLIGGNAGNGGATLLGTTDANSNMTFVTNNIPRMAITSAGYVHIGTGVKAPTNSPYSSSLLTVDGTMVAREIWVLDQATANWADYVFKKDYKLMPLAEVEKYINQNQHLPNVPSATEVESKGQNLGSLQVKQMEKIEELTLYLIQTNKSIEDLNKKVEILQKENEELKRKGK